MLESSGLGQMTLILSEPRPCYTNQSMALALVAVLGETQ
jgi:hypothetical protein